MRGIAFGCWEYQWEFLSCYTFFVLSSPAGGGLD
jgi:hypothetical protein